MRKLIIAGAAFFTFASVAYALPYYSQTAGLVPGVNDTYYIGTSSPSLLEYNGVFVKDITISGTCTGCLSNSVLAKGNFIVGNDSNLEQATSSIFITSTGQLGLGTTSPWGMLSIHHPATGAAIPIFVIASSTATATSTLLMVNNNGNVGIGTTSPSTTFVVHSSNNNSFGFGTLTNATGFIGITPDGVAPTASNYILTTNGSGSAGATILNNAGGVTQLRTNNAIRLDVLNTGEVGIGTTTPGGLLSVQPGVVNGPAFIIGTAPNTLFSIQNDGTVAASTTMSNAAAWSVGPNGATNPTLTISTASASTTNAVVDTGIVIQGSAQGSTGSLGNTTITVSSPQANEGIRLQSKGTGDAILANPGSGNVRIQTNGATRVTFTSDGRITTARSANGTASNVRFSYVDAADTALTTAVESPEVYWNLGASVRSHASGNIATQRDFRITPTQHSFTAASANNNIGTTMLAALSIDGPPKIGVVGQASTSAALNIDVTALNASTTNAYGLYINATTGAVNNYAGVLLGGSVGIGTTSPFSTLSIAGVTASHPFIISTTTATLASSTLFMIDKAGDIHLGGGTPTLSGCGTAPTLDANSTDQAGTITFGATAGGCTITFSVAKASVPHCVIGPRAISLVNAYTIAPTASAIVITQTASGGTVWDYVCALGH